MKSKQPLLVILSPGFPANEADTTCLTSQQNLVRAINKVQPGLKIIILSFQYPFINDTYNWFNNTVISLNGRNKGKFSRLWVWKKVWQQLNVIKTDNEISGLLSFWCGECALLGKIFGSRYHIPHYCWILGQDAKAQNKFVRYIKPPEEQLVALSDFLQDEFFRNHGIKPKYVIPNGIDPVQFPDPPFNKLIDVLGVGSLISLKQYDIFVQVIQDLQPEFPHIVAVICGNGPEMEYLRTLIEKNGLQKNISLLGEIPHTEVLGLMQKSKILLHPSSYEGFSTVCLEALYAGNRVISFCRPMNASIDNWYIVTKREEITEKMSMMLNNNTWDQSQVIPFTMDQTAKGILKLYGHTLSTSN